MYNLKVANNESFKEKLVGLDLDKMAQAYMDMGEINLELSGEMRHLESEAEFITEKFIGTDIGVK